jgi:hypothetical protein
MGNWQKREARRNEIVKKAIEAADRIILDGSDGSVEETNFLTGEVARKFMEKALMPFNREISRKDMTNDSKLSVTERLPFHGVKA